MRTAIWGAALLISASLAGAACAQSPLKEINSPGAHRAYEAAPKSASLDLFLTAKGGGGDKIEYMVTMKAGEVLTYTLTTPQPEGLWQEMHGHTADSVIFYKKAEGSTHHGSLVAPFDGVHGWYLENRNDTPLIVRLNLNGFFELIEPGDEGNATGAVPGVPPILY